MRDYSKRIDELSFLKRYLILETEIEAKYAPDKVIHYPKTDHNIECLNRELERQLERIKENCLPIFIKYRKKYIVLSLLWTSQLASGVAISILEREGKDIWLQLLICGLPLILNALDIARFQGEIQEIKDMEYIVENLSEMNIDFESLNLSESAKESLGIYGNLSLNNVECFTHEDIQKIKKHLK